MAKTRDIAADPDTSVDLLIKVHTDADIGRVGDAVRAAGLKTGRILPRSRILAARGPRKVIDTLERVPGVASVRVETSYQLPPFDERIPQ